MSDIDFDELDKAVASVLNAGDTTPVQSPAQPVAVQPAMASPQGDTAPEPGMPAPVVVAASNPAEPVAGPKPVTAQSLHAQPVKPVQRGRFLDMVHPSGDMSRPAALAVVRPAPVLSNGAFVSDVIAPQPAVQTPPVSPGRDAAEPEVRVADTPATETATETPDFFAASPDDASPHKAPVTDTPKPAEAPISPFIPDAKVEKRPLGAFSASDASPSSLPTGSDLERKLAELETEDNVTAVVSAGSVKSVQPAKPATPAAEPEKPAKVTVTPVSSDIAPVSVTTPLPATASTAPAEPSHGFALFPHHEHAAKTPKLRGENSPKYGRGTFIWLTVAVAIMLIGFGVGASLYILLFQ